MLSFVMVTHNEGVALDTTLRSLGQAMRTGDQLIAIDAASTDDTTSRLRAFGNVVGCQVIAINQPALSTGEALAMALDVAKAPYLMLLGTKDHLYPAPLMRLRAMLDTDQPDLVVLNSGWWSGDPTRAQDRLDSKHAATLPRDVTTTDLYGLCPDVRRCVLSRDAWQSQRNTFSKVASNIDLYMAIVKRTAGASFFRETPVLHLLSFTNPAPLLDAMTAYVTALPRPDQSKSLGNIMVWADEAVTRTAPDAADGLITDLEKVLRLLPRRLHTQLRGHNGPAGAILTARKSDGRNGALLRFMMGALATQQQHNDSLASEVTTLRRLVNAALPGPKYLRDLYDRAQDL